jgi:RNA polymerase sigma factor (sigma-70 family)
MGNTSDDVLWRRTARGDRDAFGELFDRQARRVHGFCLRQTGDWALAEDLTSITFLEAWRRRNSVVIEDGKGQAWLLGIAANCVRHERRSRRRYRNALNRLPMPLTEPDHAEQSAARAAAENQATQLLEQLRGFSYAQRMAFALVTWEGLSVAEAAATLGQRPATVRSNLHRLRKKLREQGLDGLPRRAKPQPPVSVEERMGV